MITKPPTAAQIPADPFSDPTIARRLAGYNIRSAVDWKRLGRARLALFGVTPRLIAALDELAKATQP